MPLGNSLKVKFTGLIMGAGRKRKPTAMLKSSGTYREDRHGGKMNTNVSIPHPPTQIEGISKETYDFIASRLNDLGVISELDGFALQMISDAWEDYISARSVIRQNGPTYSTETSNGDIMFRPRPELAMMTNAWDRLKKMLSEFGLTAASRAKINVEEKMEDIEDLLS